MTGEDEEDHSEDEIEDARPVAPPCDVNGGREPGCPTEGQQYDENDLHAECDLDPLLAQKVSNQTGTKRNRDDGHHGENLEVKQVLVLFRSRERYIQHSLNMYNYTLKLMLCQ
jgi:hypothetical protein